MQLMRATKPKTVAVAQLTGKGDSMHADEITRRLIMLEAYLNSLLQIPLVSQSKVLAAFLLPSHAADHLIDRKVIGY